MPQSSSHIAFNFTEPPPPSVFKFGIIPYSSPDPSAIIFELSSDPPPPITKEMLLSLGLRFHGQVYKYWICQMSHGVQQVRRYSIPPDPKTLPQLLLRSKWAAGVQAWHNLSDSGKLYWRRVGVRKLKPITSLNAFMSAWMKGKIDSGDYFM